MSEKLDGEEEAQPEEVETEEAPPSEETGADNRGAARGAREYEA
jgi:hypothetical protein